MSKEGMNRAIRLVWYHKGIRRMWRQSLWN